MTDQEFVIKPEPRKPRRVPPVLVALVLIAVVGAGFLAYGSLTANGVLPVQAPAASLIPVAGDAVGGELPSIIVAVLPLAPAQQVGSAQSFAEDSSERLVDALKVRRSEASYFTDGLASHLIEGLSQFAGVAAISQESSFPLRDSREVGRAIGKKLGATHLLQGSAQRRGEDVLVDASLVRISDGSTLWFDHYQRPYKELFQLQDDLMAAIGSALKVQRMPAPQGSQDTRPQSGKLAAYDALLQGDALAHHLDQDRLRQAVSAYEQAVKLDKEYAHAYARRALARIQLATRFPADAVAGDARGEGERARRDAMMALRLAPNSASAHAANAAWLSAVALDQAGAMLETTRALELRPQDPSLRHSLAIQQTAFGQLEEAAGNLRRVLALNPLSSTVQYNLGGVYLGKNDFSEAEFALQQALALRPDVSVVRAFQAIAVFQQNRTEEAIRLAASEPDPLWRSYALAMAYWAKGDRTRSDVELHSLIRNHASSAATQIAGIYAQRDDEAAMFQWLDR
ncbi:MAG: tetratricopeptide repeat protein, partial [Pseudomonadota bacterium]|nr:tetratricopeptide repeat protein [Pseudomonadota bacterium]